ncbi:MAG: DMT family transporter [Gammaproteobacteria bacterium]|nr:DMT family transporter [Gammaproteobacteria bacterium]
MLLLLLAGVTWGGFYHVAKAVLSVIDAFGMVMLRYGFTSLLFALMLWRFEGLKAFRMEGEGSRLFLTGAIGFAAFNFLTFIGLSYSTPEHGTIIMALMPMITASINWARSGSRPAAHTLASIALAMAGVVLVITRGDFASLLASKSALGDLLLLGGASCWVVYTLMSARYAAWSPLRYTTLTTLSGTVTVLAVVALAFVLGWTELPTVADMERIGWHLAYIVLFASVAAVVAWNVGIRIIGPLNGVLFINLLPISAFAIGVAQGKSFSAAELAGAVLVIGALVLNSLLSRRGASAALA